MDSGSLARKSWCDSTKYYRWTLPAGLADSHESDWFESVAWESSVWSRIAGKVCESMIMLLFSFMLITKSSVRSLFYWLLFRSVDCFLKQDIRCCVGILRGDNYLYECICCSDNYWSVRFYENYNYSSSFLTRFSFISVADLMKLLLLFRPFNSKLPIPSRLGGFVKWLNILFVGCCGSCGAIWAAFDGESTRERFMFWGKLLVLLLFY